jgi:formate/nitrite transporter FocA (FNT family)
MDYLTRFFVPTILGNMIGGTVLVGLLNHAPIASELGEDREGKAA